MVAQRSYPSDLARLGLKATLKWVQHSTGGSPLSKFTFVKGNVGEGSKISNNEASGFDEVTVVDGNVVGAEISENRVSQNSRPNGLRGWLLQTVTGRITTSLITAAILSLVTFLWYHAKG